MGEARDTNVKVEALDSMDWKHVLGDKHWKGLWNFCTGLYTWLTSINQKSLGFLSITITGYVPDPKAIAWGPQVWPGSCFSSVRTCQDYGPLGCSSSVTLGHVISGTNHSSPSGWEFLGEIHFTGEDVAFSFVPLRTCQHVQKSTVLRLAGEAVTGLLKNPAAVWSPKRVRSMQDFTRFRLWRFCMRVTKSWME